jgi:hypothetical protein
MDSHILAHVNTSIQRTDDRHSELKLHGSEMILDRKLKHTSSIRNNALHGSTFKKNDFVRFVGAESLLI